MTDIPTAVGKFNIPHLGSFKLEGANIIRATFTGYSNADDLYIIDTNQYSVYLENSND